MPDERAGGTAAGHLEVDTSRLTTVLDRLVDQGVLDHEIAEYLGASLVIGANAIAPRPSGTAQVTGLVERAISSLMAILQIGWAFRVLMPMSRTKLSRLLDDVADRDGFVAVGAQAAEVEAGAGGVAVVAPLLAEVAGVAAWALVDGDGSPAGGRRDGGGGRPGLWVAGAPGGLAAGGGAVGLPADRGERLPAGGAGCGVRCGDVVTDVVRKRRDKPV